MAQMPVTVLIVDDHDAFRRTARALLEADGFSVVGDVPDGASALAHVRQLQPQLVLLDIQLPDLDGFEVARRLDDTEQPPVIVFTSSRDVSAYRQRLARSSARGFISKSDLSGKALAALVA
jgi:DNA-binding NarL/FixJ family response regulator